MSETGEASPARVVADAGVLAADLLVGGAARRALDHVREHSWMRLVASDHLLDEAEALIADLAEPTLAADWRETVADLRTPVDHPAGDHPALASAYNGGAMHVLTLDRRLLSTNTGMYLRGQMDVSVRTPEAFDSVFDAASLYGAVEGGEYPGPDRDPRS